VGLGLSQQAKECFLLHGHWLDTFRMSSHLLIMWAQAKEEEIEAQKEYTYSFLAKI
jgi:hypothetical protein